MKNKIIRTISVLLVFSMLFCLFGCKKEEQPPALSLEFNDKQYKYSFDAQESAEIGLSRATADRLLYEIEKHQPDFIFEDLYEFDEVKKRLNFDASVEKHQFSALNKKGELEGKHLEEIVLKNNKSYEVQFDYEELEPEYLSQMCNYIASIMNILRDKYPDVDWARVYCNLGNLKIFYDTGTLSHAQVNSDMTLIVNRSTSKMLVMSKGEKAFSSVIIHELFHIVQMGCSCEKIPNCSRRAGISVYWDDFNLNTADFKWLAEGSAEKLTTSITNAENVTYTNYINYLNTLTLSTLLINDTKVDALETICLYDDPERVFEVFGCKTQAERDEILKMMITMNVFQDPNQFFFEKYQQVYGIDISEEGENRDNYSYTIKPAVCVSAARQFFKSLANYMVEEKLKVNDVLFLVSLFEGSLQQHLKFADETKDKYNKPFFDTYIPMRNALFSAIEKDNEGLDMKTLFTEYSAIDREKNTVNAEFTNLDEEKRLYLLERAEYTGEHIVSKIKVPFEKSYS